MAIISWLIRSSRRNLHTIVSKEIIKPSSPTPSHLKRYNLSMFDQSVASTFMPMVTFYPNTNTSTHKSHEKTLDLKNSLSQTLTKYYPLAGRHAKTSPSYVDCNDEGADFLEASIDSTLSDFLNSSRYEDLHQFFPYGRIWNEYNCVVPESDQAIPLAVQVNHFECGGIAVAMSLSHKIGDASSLLQFFSDWAKMTRNHRIEPPNFVSFPDMKLNFSEFVLQRTKECVTRSFTFPNSKISELKHKIASMTSESITDITRVEALSWLLYTCAVSADIENNSGRFRPTGLGHALNIRTKMIEPLPENTIGNILFILEIQTKNQSDMNPELLIGTLKKQKMGIRGIENIETAFGHLLSISSDADFQEERERYNNGYICSSICKSSAYEIDFGWGKPVKASVAGNLAKHAFILMDTPNQDGIEAIVCLEKQDMDIFKNDPQLLAFC